MMNKTIINKLKSCGPQLKNKINLKAHLRIMVVVGTLLNLINQYDFIVTFNWEGINQVKFLITYLVPFSVSVYSSATVNRGEKEEE